MKRLAIFGATGSVGQSTLDLVRRNPDRFEISALVSGHNWQRLAELAREFRPRHVAIADIAAVAPLREALAGQAIAVSGPDSLTDIARADTDLMVAAIVGAAGLAPTLAVLNAGITVALANKEALVCAGELMTAAAAASGARLLPVDSEHNAIFQVLGDISQVRQITLTASGGPFRQMSRREMAHVTPAQATRHPTWQMGAKISVDSATLMNKGLELIEAHYLFGVRPDQLAVLVHPQSLVHGLVEYVDGSVLAQLGPADMRVPIACALAWPERIATPVERLDLARHGQLQFEAPDRTRFPALSLAEAALAAGGCRPCVLNAANEVAVAAFLAGRIGFLAIADIVAATLEARPPCTLTSLEDVTAADRDARRLAARFVADRSARSSTAQHGAC